MDLKKWKRWQVVLGIVYALLGILSLALRHAPQLVDFLPAMLSIPLWLAVLVVGLLLPPAAMWGWDRWKDYWEPKTSFKQPGGPKWEYEVENGEVVEESLQPYCPVCEEYPLSFEIVESGSPYFNQASYTECKACGEYSDSWHVSPRKEAYRKAQEHARSEGLVE